MKDAGWLPINPLLTDCENGCVRFADDSPARERGIVAIDVSLAGMRRED